MIERIETDVLVIGGGGAGARAAIEAHTKGASVILASKGPISRSGTTPQAWPSYEAPFGFEDPRDNPEVHFHDTVREGRFLGDENLVWPLASEAGQRALDLQQYGVRFEEKDGRFLQVHHPGQTYPRNLVIKGGGYGLISGLLRELRRRPDIKRLPDVMVTRLLLAEERVVGATALNLRDGAFFQIRSKAIVLCTGGYEQLWLVTDTAPDVTGDGVALAYRAGAQLVDMEMMLYYPTVMVAPRELTGILVQYEGLMGPEYVAAKMLNGRGEAFLPSGQLPVRDVLTRLIFDQVREGRGTPNGGVWIDLRQSPKSPPEIDELLALLKSLPYNNLQDLGIDLQTAPIEVAPGTHFTLGGVHIDELGRTNVSGLFAAGELTGNVHGANRLSGNALAETQVFGARAGAAAAAESVSLATLPEATRQEVDIEHERVRSMLTGDDGSRRPGEVKGQLQTFMQRFVGMPRERDGLDQALAEIRRLRREDLLALRVLGPKVYNNDWRQALEVDLMLDVAETVVVSALFRTESRGHHQRSDFPGSNEEWLRHTAVKWSEDGPMTYTVPVVRREGGPQ